MSCPLPNNGFCVLDELLTANCNWVASVLQKDPDFFKRTAQGQNPKVLWIGCSDSRVPESVITSSMPGDIFVTRNIANSIRSQFQPKDDSVQSVLTFALKPSIAVDHVIVCGHTRCGGCQEAWNRRINPPQPPPPKDPTPVDRFLEPLVSLANTISPSAPDPVRDLIKLNVKVAVSTIRQSEAIKHAGRDIYVHGWLYDLDTGCLSDLGY